ncbi:MAG: hypothetical protein JWQ85_1855 [Mucilaginibacter sp.]|nr:hypothetical protein [Mucilaginibacter sp.]
MFQPNVKTINLTRESVSMGDDAFDHSLKVEVDRNWNISQILEKIIEINYLPQIHGGKATWSVAHHTPLAIVAQQWGKPELICGADYPYANTEHYITIGSLHFNYHAQQDPITVLEILRRYRDPQ